MSFCRNLHHNRDKMVFTIKDLNFEAGQELTVAGKVNSSCSHFSINIGHDFNSLALHFNPRFKHQKDKKVIVINSTQGGSWGSEQKESNFPFQHDGEFKVVFSFNNDQFYIRLPDGTMVGFPNRFGDDRFDHLHVDGDVKIHSIKIL
ncbi:beta-galactoside-binding lectin-like [Pygocentrus nattereri]|uniref:beta-galactoside-binding lectin-like n=1 Tax=Pygocentrus nattereri TaxID=42514 RepID=UPI001891E991|nr:beta-galactoside-binding lectin-like [Pygocentrus nattereri]